MPNTLQTRLCRLAALLLLIFGSAAVSGRAIAQTPATEVKTLHRNLEAVAVSGTLVGDLSGAPLAQLFVYTYSMAGWGGQIPIQIDERDAGGAYVSAEDNLLDANDEIVFMAMDLGDRAPDTASLAASLNISPTWYEIQVADPLSPTQKGWAYLVRSQSLSPTFRADYVDYNAAARRLNANRYTLGYTNTFFGLDHVALNGGSNLLDRSKLRAVFEVTGLGPVRITEDNLGPPPEPPSLIKDGPVRVLLQQEMIKTLSAGPAMATAGFQSSVAATAAAVQSSTNFSFTINLPGVTLVRSRVSLDFDNSLSAAFYNANVPAGVAIDGNPDLVAATPVSHWSQLSHSSGRLIQVIDLSDAGGVPQNFYRDDPTPEVKDTGQPGSRGDHGFAVENPVSDFSVNTILFVLPAGAENVGALYEAYFFNPLLITTTLRTGASQQPPEPAGPKIYLPLLIK